jgi:hypothetical protein
MVLALTRDILELHLAKGARIGSGFDNNKKNNR